METSEDKQWASKYLLDPLTAPNPSEETGPGTHHRFSLGSSVGSNSSHYSGKDKKSASASGRETGYPTPPTSASPQTTRFPHPQEALRGYNERPSTEIPTSSAASTTSGRQRGSSLTSRFPGDESHRPLNIIKKETKIANRAAHLRKQHYVGPDSIDKLDIVGGKYHHDGPYDATLLARNTSFLSSPVEAVSTTNEETLKATPKEKIIDSIEKHRPLDGVAIVPPGTTDRDGNIYQYEDGSNMMIEDGGDYKRWEGVTYHPDDFKGKGEPSFSVEKALKEHKIHRQALSNDNDDIEMTPRPRSSHGSAQLVNERESEGDMRRSNTTGRKSGNKLTRRLGSLRKSNAA